ncbi:MAG: tRNA uridine(34) 5-carboxymethylaminomethyl modification radical SAM/GNAT enzyme Elp3, partial [Dehalococcoidia bacterium]
GRALLLKAEDIALNEFHVDRMIILSGVGAREYYRNDFGYSLVGDYMVKNLQNRD